VAYLFGDESSILDSDFKQVRFAKAHFTSTKRSSFLLSPKEYHPYKLVGKI
jgi:hypothetical protein